VPVIVALPVVIEVPKFVIYVYSEFEATFKFPYTIFMFAMLVLISPRFEVMFAVFEFINAN
jgi:hypothetical protein